MISIIVCTYNRSESLRSTLDSIKKLSVPEDIQWELIIVDNNSKDNTREVVEKFIEKSDINCRYIFEKQQGLSFSRNSGISNANGEIIAFTDDDVIVDENWIRNIGRMFENKDVACVGGKILPVWEKPCPNWLKGELLFNYLALCDLGEETIKLVRPTIWGANLSIRTSIFEKYGVFDTNYGHTGEKLYGGEETNYLMSLMEAGEGIFYCPNILVHHCIPGHRMKKSYFRKWMHDKGELSAIQMGKYNNRNLFGIPLYMIKRTMKALNKYMRIQIFHPENAFHKQLDFYYHLGILEGRMKYTKDRS